ncbi:MAG: hypothetical protein ACVCEJ_03015 [Candidatus Izemoplasmataceae bacterium]
MLYSIFVIPILALVLTVGIEVVVAMIFRFQGNNRLKVVALASVITNPILTFVLSVLAMFTAAEASLYVILVLEVIVVMVEYYILHYVYGKKETKKRLFVLSLSMNAASYLVGVLVFEQIVHFLLGTN